MVTFRIDDMTCGQCAARIARAVSGVDPNARLDFRIPEKLVHLDSAVPASGLADAIREAGYAPREVSGATPSPAVRGGCGCRSGNATPAAQPKASCCV